MAAYVVRLRSKKKDRLGPEIIREFGGSAGRSFEYRVEDIKVEAESDFGAMRTAKRIARKRDMLLLCVEKIVYARKAPLPF